MKTKRFLSLILAVLLIFSVSVTAFAETPTFSKSFETFEEMKSFIENYSADYPYVEYASDKIFTPAKGYSLKNKELLQVYINNPEYVQQDLMCGETAYEMGVCYTNARYKKADGLSNVRIYVNYSYAEQRVNLEVGKYLDDHDPTDYQVIDNGEIGGYSYVVVQYFLDGGEDYRYIVAAEDVLITCYADIYDDTFLDSLLIEKTGIVFPVNEVIPDRPQIKYEVSDELLSAVRVDYHNEEIEKGDIHISDFVKITDTKQFVRFTVSDYLYTCDLVQYYVGDYILCGTQRPLPQVFYDGVLYDLKDAYEQGVVSDADLDVISRFESKHYIFVNKHELYGDITGDFVIDIYDATTIQRCLAGLSKLSWQNGEEYADFDMDGKVTILDATGIQMKVAKLI